MCIARNAFVIRALIGPLLVTGCGAPEHTAASAPLAAASVPAATPTTPLSRDAPASAASPPLGADASAPASPAPSPQPPPVAGYDLGSPARNADIEALVKATEGVVTSPSFRDHLLALTALRATPDAPGTLCGEDVYAAYVGLDSQHKPGPIRYQPKFGPLHTIEGCSGQTASTGFGGASGSTVFLNKCTFERAAARPTPAASAVEPFACAINTIAHEWFHAISGDDGRERYLDRGHKPASGMLVSYTVGAIAQCTYLESGDYLPGTFESCLDAAGTNILKTASCRIGWAKKHTQ